MLSSLKYRASVFAMTSSIQFLKRSTQFDRVLG